MIHPVRSAISCMLIASTVIASCNTSRVTEQRLVHHVDVPVDTDCDGIPDEVETKHGLDPKNPADATADPDGDDIPSNEEIALGSDPRDRDTDDDGIPDGTDLETGSDVDHDGVVAPFDNCPQDPNADQSDLDADGRGDACDDDLPRTALAEAWGRALKDHALLPLAGGTADRALADRGDLLPMPASFRVLATPDTPYVKTRPLYELWHATTGDHAYASTDTDRGLLIRRGYQDLGVLGYLGSKPFPGDHGVEVRRFAHPSTREEAVAVTDATAQVLLADGYVEQALLGYALDDGGHARRPRPVVRYLQPGKTQVFRHQATPLVDTGYTSDGTRFAVLPEKIDGALPLYRLRDGAGVERLSSDPGEVEALRAEGFLADGLIGWLVADDKVVPNRRVDELWRLERDGEHRYALDRAEREALADDGWVETKQLGYAFPATERVATCVGPTPVQQLEDKLRGMDARPDDRAAATLTAIVMSCALIRAIEGKPAANQVEKIVADRLPRDPEIRRRLLDRAKLWDQIDSKLRADALGKYRHLDPGACVGPANVDAIRDGVYDAFFNFSGTPPSLREPFCDGTLYGPGDPAAGTAVEARAVTTAAKPVGEFGENIGARPRLEGVLANSGVRGHAAAEAYAAANPDIGYNLSGVDTGLACSATQPCAATQGLRCENARCIAYPIVRAQTLQTFTGTNFWDVVDGHVVLREVGSAAETRLPDEIITNEPPDDSRCSLWDHHNRATIESPLAVSPGRFYEVEKRNTNGMFYEHDEEVPFDEATARANGRTIHMCWRANDPDRPPGTVTDCTAPFASTAACPIDGPACGPGVGGVWGGQTGARPRSLAYCRTNLLNCGETPREFSSRAPNTAPQLIFVENAAPTKRVVTSLQGVTCHNETHYDWAGSDELGVILTAAVGANAPPNAPAIDVTSQAWQRSFDSGDRATRIRQVMTTVSLEESADQFRGAAAYLITLMEDDFSFWEVVVGVVLIGAAIAIAGWLFPALASISTLVGLGALLAGLWTVYIQFVHGPDDLLGRDAWPATIADVTDRGLQSHDLNFGPLAPLMQLPGIDLLKAYRGAYDVSVHPSVDNLENKLNSEISGIECFQDSDCSSNKKCAIGVCVRSDWTDLEPGVSGGQPGFLERREFVNSDEWRYDIWLGWHVEP